MKDLLSNKLFSLLVSFSSEEWREFGLFLNSEFINPPARVLRFYKVLDKYYPFKLLNKVKREELFVLVFDKIPFDDKKLRYLCTDMLREAERFLKFKLSESKEHLSQSLLLEELARRGADKAYLSRMRSDDSYVTLDATDSADKFYLMYRNSFSHLNYYLPRQPRGENQTIVDTSRYLDIFYITRKLQLLCEMVNLQNVLAVNYTGFLEKEIMSRLEEGMFSDIPVIVIYYRIYNTLIDPDNEQNFRDLKKLLIDNESKVRKEELRDMYQYLMNYCIKKINQGITTYVQTLFRIYQAALSGQIIFQQGKLSQWDFKNIVVIGIRAGELPWVKNFIETGISYLDPAERENAYNYNLAYLYFSEADYKKAMAQLQKVEFTDIYYQLDMRAILLKCYFETDDQDAFYYHTAAFKIFISRNSQVSDYQSTIYLNLIKFSSAVLKAGTGKQKLLEIRKKIDDVKQIADINWLRKKIDELL